MSKQTKIKGVIELQIMREMILNILVNYGFSLSIVKEIILGFLINYSFKWFNEIITVSNPLATIIFISLLLLHIHHRRIFLYPFNLVVKNEKRIRNYLER